MVKGNSFKVLKKVGTPVVAAQKIRQQLANLSTPDESSDPLLMTKEIFYLTDIWKKGRRQSNEQALKRYRPQETNPAGYVWASISNKGNILVVGRTGWCSNDLLKIYSPEQLEYIKYFSPHTDIDVAVRRVRAGVVGAVIIPVKYGAKDEFATAKQKLNFAERTIGDAIVNAFGAVRPISHRGGKH